MTGGTISEDQLEEAITRYLGVVLPDNAVAYHIPNGTNCTPTQAAKQRRAGLRAGMPDRGIIYGGTTYYIEAKRPKVVGFQRAGVLTDKQKAMFPKIEAAGAVIRVCYSLEDVEAALIAFGIPIKSRMFT